MSTRGHALSRMSAALSIAILVAGCGDEAVTSLPGTRQFTPVMSRVAVPMSGQHVFLLKGNVPADFASRVAARGGSVLSSSSEIGVVVTQGLSDADANALAGNDSVASDVEAQWIAPDSVQAFDVSSSAPVDAASANPPLTAQLLAFQWNMFQIHAPEAWAAGRTGRPAVRVAILDTGLDPDHLDQKGLIDMGASAACVPSTQGPPAWVDDNTHGTYVGGLVTSNNFRTTGVAPNVTLIAVKVLGANGSGPLGCVIAGIVYATDVGAQVINMSLGAAFPKNLPGVSVLVSAFNRAVAYAKRHGVVVVSSAGNEFTDLQHNGNSVELPCEAGVQICVSATGNGDTFASYSNFGTNAINVAAPGGDGPLGVATWVLGLCSSHTTDPRLAGCRIPDRTGPFAGKFTGLILATGTSGSAPHVSGLAALLDSQLGGPFDASKVITGIQQNADDIGKPGADPFFGKGRINVFKTVNETQP